MDEANIIYPGIEPLTEMNKEKASHQEMIQSMKRWLDMVIDKFF